MTIPMSTDCEMFWCSLSWKSSVQYGWIEEKHYPRPVTFRLTNTHSEIRISSSYSSFHSTLIIAYSLSIWHFYEFSLCNLPVASLFWLLSWKWLLNRQKTTLIQQMYNWEAIMIFKHNFNWEAIICLFSYHVLVGPYPIIQECKIA